LAGVGLFSPFLLSWVTLLEDCPGSQGTGVEDRDGLVTIFRVARLLLTIACVKRNCRLDDVALARPVQHEHVMDGLRDPVVGDMELTA
jgi:hypothetical protein